MENNEAKPRPCTREKLLAIQCREALIKFLACQLKEEVPLEIVIGILLRMSVDLVYNNYEEDNWKALINDLFQDCIKNMEKNGKTEEKRILLKRKKKYEHPG